MVVTIIVGVLVGGWLIYNLIKMINNVRNGHSIDGCDGNCAKCGSCGKHYSKKQKREAMERYKAAIEAAKENKAASDTNNLNDTEAGKQ